MEGCEIDIMCFIETGEQGSFYLDSQLMGDIHALGMGVMWDIYRAE